MEAIKALLLACLLALSLLAQCSLASPLVIKDRKSTMPGAIQSALAALRTRRTAIMNAAQLEPVAAVVPDGSPDSLAPSSLLLSRLRRSMAHMYTGNIHYNSHRRGNRGRRGRRPSRRHRHHHRRQGGGRVYEA